MSGERGFWFAGVCFQSTNFQCRKINSIKNNNNKKPLIVMNLSPILASDSLHYTHSCVEGVDL